jgi:DNA mismatch repair protein MLH1
VKLYLVDYGLACNEFFYQVGLTDFGNFGVIKLDPPPKLVDLLQIAVDAEKEEQADGNNPEAATILANAAELISRTLVERREMLDEYFSMKVSEEGELLTLPLLLKGYVPSLAKLPRFLLRLGPYVDWTDEEECFRTFLRELAAFYTPEQLPVLPSPPSKDNPANLNTETGQEAPKTNEDSPATGNEDPLIQARRTQMMRMLEYAVFPAIRSRLVATSRMLKGVVEVADLKGLYRVFERC